MRRILAGFAAGAMLAAGVLVLLQYLVDPYDYFGMPTLSGFNAQKPFMYDHARLAKTQAIARRHPAALILGGSTIEGGLDPAHPALAAWPGAYNAALPSGRFYESYRLLQHALAHGRVDLAIVSLDFINWVGAPDISVPGFSEASLATRFDGTLNVGASSASLRRHFRPGVIGHGLVTLSYQDPRVLVKGTTLDRFPTHWYRENGQRDHESSLRYGIAFRGFDLPFRRYMQTQQARLSRVSADNPFPARVAGEDYFALIQRFVKLAREQEVRLMFLMPPCHASMLETYIGAAVWDEFGVFKERVVAALDAAERDTGLHVPVFDFCVYAPPNSEPILSRGDQRAPPLTYWDPAHLSDRTGDLALSIMFGDRAPIGAFGTDLRTAGSIPRYMEQDLARREILRRSQAEEFAAYRANLSSVNAPRPSPGGG